VSPTMKYRRMGRTGLRLSAVGLGTWATIGERLDDDASLVLLDEAHGIGINYFDTAETYADGGAEQALGRALTRLGWPRETYVLSAKVYWGVHGGQPNTWGLSRKHVHEGCHASLRRLGVEHLDLFLCHRADPNTPLEETVLAMSDLVRRGTVLYWGTSEWEPAQVERAHRIASELGAVPPSVEQLQYNLLHRTRVERDFAEPAARLGLGITTWSPLAYGLLTGRYDDGISGGRLAEDSYRWLRTEVFGADKAGEEATLRRCRRFTAVARDLDVAPAALALAWVLRDPVVTSAICGASSPTQLQESVRALDLADQLDKHVLDRLDAVFAQDGA
jgi:voltage-dependent potassium channel beta subunit